MVITVPAYFGLLEREATRKAGQIAGLNVLDVLAEPVAAALHYQALGEEHEVRHILVYDLGGGTFDTTVIRIDGDDIHVVCTDGDHHLGGADWDSTISDFLLRGFTEQYPQLDPGGDEQFMQDLATSAEQLKKALSAAHGAQAQRAFRRLGRAARADQGALRGAHLRAARADHGDHRADDRHGQRAKGVEHFDDVLLVGGMTIMPAVARTLQGAVRARGPAARSPPGRGQGRRAVRAHEEGEGQHPAAGRRCAACRSSGRRQTGLTVEQVESLVRKKVTTVVPRAFGLKVVDQNDPVYKIDPSRARRVHLAPAHRQHAAACRHRPAGLRTVADNQREVQLEVWEQAGAIASDEPEHNTHIGEGRLRDLPRRPAGTPFEVVFHMTETGLLQVHAREAEVRPRGPVRDPDRRPGRNGGRRGRRPWWPRYEVSG